MKNNAVRISGNFKKMAIKSVFAIIFFIFTYLLLIITAIGLSVLCAYAGIKLIIFYPSIPTFMLGIGIGIFGFLVLVFLLKFMFSSSKIDRSYLIEVTAAQQPQLFKFIKEIVDEVKTDFPKKIYVSSEVNASVFYDSSFWSMFFPVKKSLQIGMGLLNSISVIELKAILAHEFGHFSQRSMKVGSYVYNVNIVIHNILYDNDSYNELMQSVANVSSYFSAFVAIAIRIIALIQVLLKKVYVIVNINYLALSREMEFHADAVSTHVAGSQPLINSLLRLELADHSLNIVYNYYNSKIENAEKTVNFYPQQYFVMTHIAKAQKLPMESGLPIISIESNKRFNKSKLVLKDQWSSHPATEDRISELLILDKPTTSARNELSSDLLIDIEALQEKVTELKFQGVNYEKPPVNLEGQRFQEDYEKEYCANSLPELYKGYYDRKELYNDFDDHTFDNMPQSTQVSAEALFDNETLDTIFTLQAMEGDLEILQNIKTGLIEIKTFDYDGIKYSPIDTDALITYLNGEAAALKESIRMRDIEIFNYFFSLANTQGIVETFKEKYHDYLVIKKRATEQQQMHTDLLTATNFIRTSTPFYEIRTNILEVKKLEVPFKEEIQFLLDHPAYKEELGAEQRESFNNYISEDLKYFGNNVYYQKELDLLFIAMAHFFYVINNTNFRHKKLILSYLASLDNSNMNVLTSQIESD